MSNIIIKVEDICKRFDNSEIDAVSHVNLEIEEGQIVTILGTSGSGKTTLLKMINRLYEPTSGEIYFNGEAVTKLPVNDYRRKIGYVIQQSGLFPHMTVEENIAAVPRLLKWDEKRIKARVDELLVLIGLDPERYRKRFPRQLSGGEQQRVGLARAMASDPAVMLMDEPFGAIDAITRTGLQDELKRIQSELKKTILFVTHDIQEAFKLGDRVIIMDQGKLQQFDTPYNILFHPQNDYVRKLTATNNLYDRLKLIHAEDIVEENTKGQLENLIPKDTDLGETLTYLVKNNLQEVGVSDQGKQIGVVTMKRIWDTVRPSLQGEQV